ncbi:VirC2 family conjugal transfer protein [Mesorhizobium sp. GbtcB19]|uniref:VirC2 family conjugal transfer protein n=1 Tax=Mesorhizobium sp. GbtcB19 TaxID=2824764 RepID=UPI001C306565|nr:VirC2 family conjugal transfer protein [Mesorhizobium sp. GbtcB19]
MAIRKPTMSAEEARRLATIRLEATTPLAGAATLAQPQPASSPAAATEPVTRAAAAARADRESVMPSGNIDPPVASRNVSSSTVRPSATFPRQPPSSSLAKTRLDKIQVFLSAPLPAQGVSSVFATLQRQYPPPKALQMILRKALDDYEDMLEKGAFQKLPATYAENEINGSIVQTSRMIPKALVAIARAHFDPLGLESTRSFGRKFATAALAAFFANETKRPG